MKSGKIWYTLVGVVGTAVLFFLLYYWQGTLGLVTALFLAAVILIIWLYFRQRLIVLNEMEIGVIFHRRTGNFIRFIITPDPKDLEQPANQQAKGLLPTLYGWIVGFLLFLKDIVVGIDGNWGSRMFSPYHYLLASHEKLESIIPKKSQKAIGTAAMLRTKEGIPVDIGFKISYTINIARILPGIEHKMARALPKSSDGMVAGRAKLALKHIVEKMSIRELYALSNPSPPMQTNGALKQLEDTLRAALNERLQGLGFKEIPLKDVELGPVLMPLPIERALESAHQRQLQTTIVAESLRHLQEVVHSFTDADMARLQTLERLRILDTRTSRVNMSDLVIQKNKRVVGENASS